MHWVRWLLGAVAACAGRGSCMHWARWPWDILFEPFIQLLLVILQVHYGLLGQLQVSLQLPLVPFQVYTKFLLLFQGAFQLRMEGGGESIVFWGEAQVLAGEQTLCKQTLGDPSRCQAPGLLINIIYLHRPPAAPVCS